MKSKSDYEQHGSGGYLRGRPSPECGVCVCVCVLPFGSPSRVFDISM